MKQALCSDAGMVILSVATPITTGALSLSLFCRAEIFTRHYVRKKKNIWTRNYISPSSHCVVVGATVADKEEKKNKFKRKHIVGPPFPPDFVPHHKGWQWFKRELHKFLILRLDSYLLFKSLILIEFWSFCLNVLSHVSSNAPLNEVLCEWADTLRRTDYLFRQWLNFLSSE